MNKFELSGYWPTQLFKTMGKILFIYSFATFIYLLVPSFVHSFIHVLVHSFVYSLVHCCCKGWCSEMWWVGVGCTGFVDLEKAFDRFPLKLFWWALRCLSVDEWVMSIFLLFIHQWTVYIIVFSTWTFLQLFRLGYLLIDLALFSTPSHNFLFCLITSARCTYFNDLLNCIF